MARATKSYPAHDASNASISIGKAVSLYADVSNGIERLEQASERIYPATSPLRYANAYLSDDKTELERMFDEEIELALFYKDDCDKVRRKCSSLEIGVRKMSKSDIASFLINIGKASPAIRSPGVHPERIYDRMNETLDDVNTRLIRVISGISDKLTFLKRRKAAELG